MEFKTTNRHSRQRPLSVAPPRRDARSVTPGRQPRVAPAPAQNTENPQPKVRRQSKLTRRTAIILVLAIITSTILISIFMQRSALTGKVVKTSEANEVIENLEYQTIIPDGKTISSLGGWRRVSPANGTPVYAYGDRIGEVAINVSQQPLPGSFIGDSDRRVAELAKSYSAETEIDANGTKAYVGTSAKGPQSVIFTKNNLLILIKSEQKIPNSEWADYIETLN